MLVPFVLFFHKVTNLIKFINQTTWFISIEIESLGLAWDKSVLDISRFSIGATSSNLDPNEEIQTKTSLQFVFRFSLQHVATSAINIVKTLNFYRIPSKKAKSKEPSKCKINLCMSWMHLTRYSKQHHWIQNRLYKSTIDLKKFEHSPLQAMIWTLLELLSRW